MAQRVAFLTIYQDPEVIANVGYHDAVKAFCVLNNVMVAFTILEHKSFFSRKAKYELSVKLHSLIGNRPYGNKMFDTYEEALEFGKEFVALRFPEATNEEAVAQLAE